MEVAKRFNPTAGQLLWFADHGSLLGSAEARRSVAADKGEIYVCRRPPGGGAVEVARVTGPEIDAGAEPRFGVAW
jgi:hypothetical protein